MEKRIKAARTYSTGLTAQDLALLKKFHNERFEKLGVDVKAVGWGSRADQQLRFEVLCRQINIVGKRILDIGCGLGDFIPWAEQKFGPDFYYLGVDISEGMISAASQHFGSPRRQFYEGTIGSNNPRGKFDISILSGTFTFKTSNNTLVMQKTLSTAWDKSREAVCANFMTSYADKVLDKNHHFEPEEVLRFAKSLSKFVVLHHDYDLWEFTIQIFREPRLRRNYQR